MNAGYPNAVHFNYEHPEWPGVRCEGVYFFSDPSYAEDVAESLNVKHGSGSAWTNDVEDIL
jgi:hypothetical protein